MEFVDGLEVLRADYCSIAISLSDVAGCRSALAPRCRRTVVARRMVGEIGATVAVNL